MLWYGVVECKERTCEGVRGVFCVRPVTEQQLHFNAAVGGCTQGVVDVGPITEMRDLASGAWGAKFGNKVII